MNSYKRHNFPENQGLYDSANEHDACGIGIVANINGEKSHKIVLNGVQVLERIEHRGAVGGDPGTGDGAGLLMQIPDEFFQRVVGDAGFQIPSADEYAVGMIFLPQNEVEANSCVKAIEKAVVANGFNILGWREVPTENKTLGKMAVASQPVIRQIFVSFPTDCSDVSEAESKLFVVRRMAENAIAKSHPEMGDQFYVCSFSARTIIYKGMLMAPQVMEFFLDLSAEDFKSAVAVIHQRYSTNTFPSWPLAHPYRYIAHNGEINTLRGNVNQMKAREQSFESEVFGERIKDIFPIVQEQGSDSACLDNAVEFFTLAGRSLPHSMMMLVPQAWGEKYSLNEDMVGFYQYHAGMMEPWDGPAALAFTDGLSVGATLDRNGLRPSRYTITKDGMFLLASEAGTIDIPWDNVKKKGRLSPGEMIYIDLTRGKVYNDKEIKTRVARQKPYRRWVEENRIETESGILKDAEHHMASDKVLNLQKLYGYTREELDVIIKPMADDGKEPIGSMGNDAALAVLSGKTQLLFAYFKQLFAQVTNPPIDPIREELVTSLTSFIGNKGNILVESPKNAHLVKLKSPILSNDAIYRLRKSKKKVFSTKTITMSYDVNGGGEALALAIEALRQSALQGVIEGHSVVILSDKKLPEGHAPIPSLLACSAVNQFLVNEGVRTSSGLIIETGEAREVMHFALLLGFGATAINPYLAIETIIHLEKNGKLSSELDLYDLIKNYITSIDNGLKKIMSKMGISTLRSYRGSQIFEAIGLNSKFVSRYMNGVTSRIEGIGLDEISQEVKSRYDKTYGLTTAAESKLLEAGGQYNYRAKGENHLWSPNALTNLQEAVKQDDRSLYDSYASEINSQAKGFCTLRGLFEFKAGTPIPVDQVEPASEIMKRFVTGAMSLGSISPEVHETIAIAMNRIQGMSHSGEGGEDSVRYKVMANGDSKCSAIKQVASGRFGVTIEYLSNCKEIQIKVAQGAKPGEGGQLPGHKVNALIARVRNSTPGVTLISPPPHHDIYSIEDLAQLIYDLKNANPEARVSVKLVSEVGVGTVAAGVSKAHADMVLIAGHDGGTGASPLTSIKHCGLPWELGLAETQQTLVLNKLRDRIRVQVDGQMKTGRDIIIGALLGGEEFGFGTTALVTMGCVMMRKCHSNTCPVGVATQDPELRKKFAGKPEYLINFLRFISEEAREIMAELGIAKFDDLIGRSDLLEMNKAITFWKAKNLDFSSIFAKPSGDAPVRCTTVQDHGLDRAYDNKLIALAKESIETGKPLEADLDICNLNRTAGTMLSGKIAKKYGMAGLPDDTLKFNLAGTAGQSFGAFLAHGVTLDLRGEANDFVGKGLSGGKLIIAPPANASYVARKNVIAGNVVLYGAISGELYINGTAGERFCIRNSGALAIVEGVGDHCCEYMTGGKTIVLGPTGVNFGAGMSGGLAYVYDEKCEFNSRCNLAMVDLETVVDPIDVAELKQDIENHLKYTGSKTAEVILRDWENNIEKFVKVFPVEYKRVLGQMQKDDAEVERKAEQD